MLPFSCFLNPLWCLLHHNVVFALSSVSPQRSLEVAMKSSTTAVPSPTPMLPSW